MHSDDESLAPEIWAASDGRAGLETQVLGLAEAIARLTPWTVRRLRVPFRSPWRALPPRLAAGPWYGLPFRALADGADTPRPPWPRAYIGCGRAAIALSLALRRVSPATIRIQTQDPRHSPTLFDFVVPPEHDGLHGANVIPIIGSPNRITAETLAAAERDFSGLFGGLPRPRVAVLIGGKSKAHRFGEADAEALAAELLRLKSATGASLLVTVSRRTGEAQSAILRRRLNGAAWVWDGRSANPYFGLLAHAEHILVTADSVNMAAEAASTGKPIHILGMPGGSAKFTRFHEGLRAKGLARPFDGQLDGAPYVPLRETERAAREILSRAGILARSST